MSRQIGQPMTLVHFWVKRYGNMQPTKWPQKTTCERYLANYVQSVFNTLLEEKVPVQGGTVVVSGDGRFWNPEAGRLDSAACRFRESRFCDWHKMKYLAKISWLNFSQLYQRISVDSYAIHHFFLTCCVIVIFFQSMPSSLLGCVRFALTLRRGHSDHYQDGFRCRSGTCMVWHPWPFIHASHLCRDSNAGRKGLWTFWRSGDYPCTFHPTFHWKMYYM